MQFPVEGNIFTAGTLNTLNSMNPENKNYFKPTLST